MINSIAKLMTGVTTTMSVVSFQLIMNKNIKLPRNWSKFLINIDRLSEAALCTTVISLVNLEISYPVLF